MGIATALHVVTEANKWQQPIRVTNYELEYSRLLTTTDRVILDDGTRDSAVILFDPGEFKLPENILPLIPANKFLKTGVEVGWVGFPAVEPNTLCFFSGNISSRIKEDSAYLIDGVAINGVSGGPVLQYRQDGATIIGLITAYIANRATGETLPGLAVAQDVSHIHDVISNLKSLDEAQRKRQQLQEEIQQPKTELPDPQLPLPEVEPSTNI